LKILVTNDDGIDSAGIAALKKTLSEIAEKLPLSHHGRNKVLLGMELLCKYR